MLYFHKHSLSLVKTSVFIYVVVYDVVYETIYIFVQVYVELQQLRKVPPDCEIINFFNQKSVFNPTQALTPFLQKTPQVDQNFVLR